MHSSTNWLIRITRNHHKPYRLTYPPPDSLRVSWCSRSINLHRPSKNSSAVESRKQLPPSNLHSISSWFLDFELELNRRLFFDVSWYGTPLILSHFILHFSFLWNLYLLLSSGFDDFFVKITILSTLRYWMIVKIMLGWDLMLLYYHFSVCPSLDCWETRGI